MRFWKAAHKVADNTMKWRRIAGAVCLDLAISSLFIWNLFVNALTREFSVSLVEVNYVFALGVAAFSVGVIVGGYLADRFAPRWLAYGSGAGMVAGLWLAAASPSFFGIVIGFGLLHAAAAGLGYAAAVHEAGIINHGLALALVVSAYGAGSAMLASPIGWVIAVSSYHFGFAALGVFAAVTCGLSGYLLPNQASSKRSVISCENTGNIAPLGGLLALFWLMFGLGSAPGLISFALAGTLTGAAVYSAVIAVNVGNFSGRILAGVLSDHLGTNRVLHGNYVLLIVACGLLALAKSSWLAWVGLLMIGLQYGALSTLMPLSVRSRVPTTVFGRCFGIVFSSWGVCGLMASIAASSLASFQGSVWVLLIMLLCGLMSWVAMTAASHKGSMNSSAVQRD